MVILVVGRSNDAISRPSLSNAKADNAGMAYNADGLNHIITTEAGDYYAKMNWYNSAAKIQLDSSNNGVTIGTFYGYYPEMPPEVSLGHFSAGTELTFKHTYWWHDQTGTVYSTDTSSYQMEDLGGNHWRLTLDDGLHMGAQDGQLEVYKKDTTPITPTCTDSDGGLNYGIKGTATATNTNYIPDSGTTNKFTDVCGGNYSINEFYCDGGTLKSVGYGACYSGCYDGVCNDTCFNPVGGDYYTRGSVGIYTDYCQLKDPPSPRDESYKVASCNSETGCYLIKNYCTDTKSMSWTAYKCPNGCSNGACIQNTNVTPTIQKYTLTPGDSVSYVANSKTYNIKVYSLSQTKSGESALISVNGVSKTLSVHSSAIISGLNVVMEDISAWNNYADGVATIGVTTASCTYFNNNCGGPVCGDGYVETGEDCDRELNTACSWYGNYNSGAVTCGSNCKADTSGCSNYNYTYNPVCGDRIKNGNEQCDNNDFGSKNTQSFNLLANKTTRIALGSQTYTVSLIGFSAGLPRKVAISVNGATDSIIEGNMKTVGGIIIYVKDIASWNNGIDGYADIEARYDTIYDCSGLGYTSGTLSCTSSCLYDTHLCVNNTVSANTCTDTDGGVSYYVKGYTNLSISGHIVSYADYCYDAGTVVDYYCTLTSGLNTSTYSCPNGCSNGACISNPDLGIDVEFSTAFYNVSDVPGGDVVYFDMTNTGTKDISLSKYKLYIEGNGKGAYDLTRYGTTLAVGGSIHVVIQGNHAAPLFTSANCNNMVLMALIGNDTPFPTTDTVSPVFVRLFCSGYATVNQTPGMTFASYPQPFITQDGVPNAVFVVGRNAAIDDVIGVTDIIASLQRYAGNNPFPTGIVKFDDEITSQMYNRYMIIVGGPCANSVAANLMGNPMDCASADTPGVGKIEILPDKNAIIVHGFNSVDTTMATRVLAQWQDYEAIFSTASKICVTGTLNNMQVRSC